MAGDQRQGRPDSLGDRAPAQSPNKENGETGHGEPPGVTTPEERNEILEALGHLWALYPDLTLGRLVCVLAASHYRGVTNYPWHVPNQGLLAQIRKLSAPPGESVLHPGQGPTGDKARDCPRRP